MKAKVRIVGVKPGSIIDEIMDRSEVIEGKIEDLKYKSSIESYQRIMELSQRIDDLELRIKLIETCWALRILNWIRRLWT